MLCQRCNKNNANVHIVKLVNGEKNELWVCEECAKELSNASIAMIDGSNIAGQFEDIMGSFFQSINKGKSEAKTSKNIKSLKDDYKIEIVCKNCGLTYSEFKKNGKFGCAECYNNFSEMSIEDINKDNKEHIGKVPESYKDLFKVRKEINALKKVLKEHVAKEEYEMAAEIRDKIKEIESGLNKETSYEKLDR